MEAASQRFRDNLRKRPRRKLHYPAIIEDDERPCMIWNISSTGAKLTVGDDEVIPDEFNLLLARDGAARRRCRVIWRKGFYAGVKFVCDVVQ